MRSATPRPPQGLSELRRALDALCASADVGARLASDPLQFVRRQREPGDAEVAAIFASALAYGRVKLFWPVLETLFAAMAARGGPRAWALGFDRADDARLEPLIYRWNRGSDLSLLARATGAVLRAHGRLGAVAESAFQADHADIGPAMEAVVASLRQAAQEAQGVGGFSELPRGLRTFLPLPSEGSACKRWNLLFRWMVRSPGPRSGELPARADGVDLGLWRLPPSHLVIPLDTHVSRIARFLGLTSRTDGSWRTAAEITRHLALLDPRDPVRYDFALAHLGISGACRGAWAAEVCPACPLGPVCVMASGRLPGPARTD